jgi:hypothetical protein
MLTLQSSNMRALFWCQRFGVTCFRPLKRTNEGSRYLHVPTKLHGITSQKILNLIGPLHHDKILRYFMRFFCNCLTMARGA